MTKDNQNGFSALEGLLILVILAIISFTGYYVWHTRQATTKTYASTSNAQATVVKTKYTKPQALEAAKALYQQYVSTAKTGQAGLDAIKDQLTTQLYSSLSAKYSSGATTDQLLCSPTFPSTISAKLGAPAGQPTTATVQVNENFGDSSSYVTVGVDLNTLQLSGLVCQGQ